MKNAGIILTIFGGLLVLSGLNLALRKYNLSDVNDVSMACGGLGFAFLILAIGVGLLIKSRAKR